MSAKIRTARTKQCMGLADKQNLEADVARRRITENDIVRGQIETAMIEIVIVKVRVIVKLKLIIRMIVKVILK